MHAYYFCTIIYILVHACMLLLFSAVTVNMQHARLDINEGATGEVCAVLDPVQREKNVVVQISTQTSISGTKVAGKQ